MPMYYAKTEYIIHIAYPRLNQALMPDNNSLFKFYYCLLLEYRNIFLRIWDTRFTNIGDRMNWMNRFCRIYLELPR